MMHTSRQYHYARKSSRDPRGVKSTLRVNEQGEVRQADFPLSFITGLCVLALWIFVDICTGGHYLSHILPAALILACIWSLKATDPFGK